MSTKINLKRGRPSMRDVDKKKAVTCMLKPSLIKRLETDAIEGKAQTANQRLAQIAEMYYKNKDKKEKKNKNDL